MDMAPGPEAPLYEVITWAALVFFWPVLAWMTGRIFRQKGYPAVLGFVLGVIVPVLALLFSLTLPKRATPRAPGGLPEHAVDESASTNEEGS